MTVTELLLCGARKVLEELPQRVRLWLIDLSLAAHLIQAFLVAFQTLPKVQQILTLTVSVRLCTGSPGFSGPRLPGTWTVHGAEAGEPWSHIYTAAC